MCNTKIAILELMFALSEHLIMHKDEKTAAENGMTEEQLVVHWHKVRELALPYLRTQDPPCIGIKDR